ncbi:MAG: hypothetical protein JWO30_4671 [Fibrobacteres bacterium]|nr:hypothetical protein [Fibrobacterota bacterium]
MRKCSSIVKLFIFLASISAFTGAAHAVIDNQCIIKPVSVSVGKDSYSNYFFVVDATTWWRLGLVTDELARQRYATAMAAVLSGQTLTISYNTGSNCLPAADLWDEDISINYVVMQP